MPLPAISKRFGITVRNRRIAAHITQAILAERAGLHETYIGMVERGIRNPTLDVAERIAKGLRGEFHYIPKDAQVPQGGRRLKA